LFLGAAKIAEKKLGEGAEGERKRRIWETKFRLIQ
jgi:hypothetical protein